MDKEEVDDKIEKMWDKGFPPLPDEHYPIYDLYLKGKDPKKTKDWIFIAAFIERTSKILKSKGIHGFFADNRKRPKRIHKKICKRHARKYVSVKKLRKQLIDIPTSRFIGMALKVSFYSICDGKSPYLTDMMMDLMLNPEKMFGAMFANRPPNDNTADSSSPPPPDAPPSTDSSSPAPPES